MADLEDLLQAELSGATLESSGTFTLAREEALRKLAQFQLQFPAWWVLKVVQAGVAAGATLITVTFSLTDVQIRFQQKEKWTVEQLERDIWDPQPSKSRAVDHLKRGLWSAGFHQSRPFQVELTGSDESLLYKGTVASRHRLVEPAAETCVTVSHRRWDKGLSLLGALDAAGANQSLINTLRARAHVCPVALRVDNKRIDALQLSSTHGFGARTYPFFLATVDGPEPGLRMPRGWNLVEPHRSVLEMLQPPVAGYGEADAVGCAGMLAFGANSAQDAANRPKPRKFASLVHWVLDGVIIDTQKLPLPEGCVSCAVFANAEGLPTDLSGFGLVDGAARKQRLRVVCAQLQEPILRSRIDLRHWAGKASQELRWAGGAAMCLGVFLCTFYPPAGMAVGAMGVGAYYWGGSAENSLATAVERDLQQLKDGWPALQ